LRFFIY